LPSENPAANFEGMSSVGFTSQSKNDELEKLHVLFTLDKTAGFPFMFFISRIARCCGGVPNVFTDSKVVESFASLFQTLALAVVLLVVVSLIENRGGNDDLATMLTIRRCDMERVIKGVDAITQWRFLERYDPLRYFSQLSITVCTMLAGRDRVQDASFSP